MLLIQEINLSSPDCYVNPTASEPQTWRAPGQTLLPKTLFSVFLSAWCAHISVSKSEAGFYPPCLPLPQLPHRILHQVLIIFFLFVFISWRLITLQYCSRFCHTLTRISHGFTCVPHPDTHSHQVLIIFISKTVSNWILSLQSHLTNQR